MSNTTEATEQAIESIGSIASKDELREVQDALKEQWSKLTLMETVAFSKGDRVAFECTAGDLAGERVVARVLRVNKKSVSVQPIWEDGSDRGPGQYYRVSPSMLEQA